MKRFYYSLLIFVLLINALCIEAKPQADQSPIPIPPGIKNGINMISSFFEIFGNAFNTMWNIIPKFLELFKTLTGAGGSGGSGNPGDGISSIIPNIPGAQLPAASDQINQISSFLQSPF